MDEVFTGVSHKELNPHWFKTIAFDIWEPGASLCAFYAQVFPNSSRVKG